MFVVTILNMLPWLLKVKDKPPFSFSVSVCLFLKAIIKLAHNSDVCYCNIKLGLGKNKVA